VIIFVLSSSNIMIIFNGLAEGDHIFLK
jgi:hypothetical protein